jgi:hypothetical protein
MGLFRRAWKLVPDTSCGDEEKAAIHYFNRKCGKLPGAPGTTLKNECH